MRGAVVDWSGVPTRTVLGETGSAAEQALAVAGLRVRRVVYGAGYRADHWCRLGHVLQILEGEATLEFSDGAAWLLRSGETCVLEDTEGPAHRVYCPAPCTVLIVDNPPPQA